MKTEKLELAHLAAYLPYGLKVVFDNKITGQLYGVGLPDLLFDLTVIEIIDGKPEYKKWCLLDTKPLLRPLSELTEQHANDWGYYGEVDAMLFEIASANCKVLFFDWLCSCHYDIHNLIPAGVALPLTIQNNS